MRKIIISLLCLSAVFAINVSAQTKGEMYVGGSFNIGATTFTHEDGNLNALTYAVLPEYSYFVANNFRIGAELSCNFAADVTILTLSPSLSYYVELLDNFYYTPELTFGGGFITGKDFTLGALSVGLNVIAFEFKPSKHVGLCLNFDNIFHAYLPENSFGSVHFGILNSVGLGFRYYL